jgi:hypothetical protein
MTNRRARRTDLREGSLDIGNLFQNAQLNSEGKIILPSELDPQEWISSQIPFVVLTSETGFPDNSNTLTTLTDFYSFTLSDNIAQDDNSQYLFKVYVNGIKLTYSNFQIDNLTCYLGLPYPLESTDSIEISYVEAV